MLKDYVRDIGAGSGNRIPSDFALGLHQRFGGLYFHHRAENRGQGLQVIDPDFGQRADGAVVVPIGPGGSCVAIKGTSRMNFSDSSILQPARKGLEP